MRHPQSPRFAGALVGLGIVALAALVAVAVLVVFGAPAGESAPAPATEPVVIANLDNEELVAALGEPAGVLDCSQLGLPAGSTGFGWIDETNGRVVVVCVPPAS